MGQQATGPLRFSSRDEYLRWAEGQPRRYERVCGEVVAMSPERAGHARIKAQAWLALKRAVAAAGVSCEAFPDGMTVGVRDDTDYEPDALVNCGDRIGQDVVTVPNPVVVVEVLSPSTRSVDTGAKLADYFSLPSLHHYLIVHVNRPMVVHHRHRGDGGIDTRLLSSGAIELDPPGITITVEELYQP